MHFDIAVVMPAFNTEKYISQALDSIIDQSLDFKKHIQIIVVDDASTDNTLKIAREYQEKYSENITVLSNETNHGPGYSRNRGLDYVDADYVNFLDSDDYISTHAFKKAYEFFEKNKDINIVSIPIHFFGVKNGPHKLNFKFEKTQIINLNEYPNYFQLSGPSSFFRFSELKKYSFSENLRVSEDPLLINQMLLDNPHIGYLSDVQYYYRKSYIQESLISTSVLNKSYFTTRIDEYFIKLIEAAKEKTGHVPKFIQHVLMYDLQWILEIKYINNLLSNHEISELYDKIIYILRFIDNDVIYYQLSLPIELKEHIVLLKEHGRDYLNNKDKYQHSGDFKTLYLDHYEFLNKDELYVSGILTDYIKENRIRAFVDGKEYETTSIEYPQRTNYSLNFDFAYNHNFEVVLPIKENVNISFKSDRDDLDIDYNHTSRLSRTAKYRLSKDYLSIDRIDHIEITNKTVLKGAKLELKVMNLILKERKQGWRTGIILRIAYFLLYYMFKNRHIWVFMDLPNASGDNGYFLFRYANTSQKLKKIEKRFVFSKASHLGINLPEMNYQYLTSSKTAKIKRLLGLDDPNDEYISISMAGKMLPNRSLQHRFLLLFADFIITSHPDNDIIYPFWGNYPHLAGLAKSKTVFLQHGVTKDNISHWLNKYDKRIAMIVATSEKEKESFLTADYGYNHDQIKVLGFPRFDFLNPKFDEKTIVLMPTWRRQYDSFNTEEFKQTSYFKSYNSILNDDEFISYVKSKGYRLIFKPHRNVMKFIDAFDIPDSVGLGDEISYTDVFNRASLLITDYSSVAFDFAYLKKALIYFHPEKDYHFDLDKGYFKYGTMGFGPVTHDFNQLKDEIIKLIDSDCKMDDIYKKRVEEFFKYIDRNNCQRVVDAILELNEKFYY